MRFMILLKANKRSEAGILPSTPQLAAMGKYNEALVNAGVLVTGEGLQPTSKGVRIRFKGNQCSVTEGPFPDSQQLIAGYWIFDVASREEAIEWAERCPFPFDDTEEAELEVRQILTAEDLARNFTPRLKETERRLRSHMRKHDLHS
jgi:hypothetical protein